MSLCLLPCELGRQIWPACFAICKGTVKSLCLPTVPGPQKHLCRISQVIQRDSCVLYWGPPSFLISLLALRTVLQPVVWAGWVRGGFTGDVLVMTWKQFQSFIPCSSFSSGGVLPPLSYLISWARNAHFHSRQLRLICLAVSLQLVKWPLAPAPCEVQGWGIENWLL